MKVKPYKWQLELSEKFQTNGIVEAAPGSGKTLGAILLIKKRKYKNILIAVPTLPLKKQWEDNLVKQKVTANTIVKTFHKLYKPEHQSTIEYDLMIVDECHRSVSPKFRNLYKYQNYKHILGLTATPNRLSKRFCGDVIITVSLQEANIATFKVVFVPVELTPRERMFYQKYSYNLGSLMNKIDIRLQDRKLIENIIYKRRGLVYRAKNRIPKTLGIMNENKDKNILVICQRIEQANSISELTGFPVFHSQNRSDKVLEDFKLGKIKSLISVGMLREGFDKRDIDILIITSTALTKSSHIQSIGRAIRLPNDAMIYVLLARDTTDEKVLKFKNMYDYQIEGNFTGKYDETIPEILKQYYHSEPFSLDYKFNIFKRTSEGRKYYQDNDITKELRKFLPRGGRFRITKSNKVLIKSESTVKVIGTLSQPLEPAIEVVDYPSVNWEL